MNKKVPFFCWKNLSPVEIISLAYAILTALYIICFGLFRLQATQMLLFRAGFILATFLVVYIDCVKSHALIRFLRFALPFVCLAYWYPETYYMNSYFFPYVDSYFASLDLKLFGCEPSIEFSKLMPAKWFNEWMCFSYLSYYFIFGGVALYLYFKQKENAIKGAFIIICSFYLYYFIFILLPVAGPQFYFQSPLNQFPDAGIFRSLLKHLLETSEKPTGAFPSSHVGISFIALAIAFRYKRPLFWFLIIPVLALTASTVYIKAHYLVDVIGGIISVPVMILASRYLYQKLQKPTHIVLSQK